MDNSQAPTPPSKRSSRHTDRGKWSEAGVPHRGWSCTDVEDLGEPDRICEMCEGPTVRYVHYMEHPDYPETLAVGCVCAEHMSEDYVNPRAREKRLRTRARRRNSWDKRSWNISQRGNSYLNTEGYNLTIFSGRDDEGAFYSLRVTNRVSGQSQQGNSRYQSEDEAKRAALDALFWAKDNL